MRRYRRASSERGAAARENGHGFASSVRIHGPADFDDTSTLADSMLPLLFPISSA
jgi:hypothetical protein